MGGSGVKRGFYGKNKPEQETPPAVNARGPAREDSGRDKYGFEKTPPDQKFADDLGFITKGKKKK